MKLSQEVNMTDTPSAINQIPQFVARIQEIEAEIKEKQEDKKEVYAEAKCFGLDTKIIRKIVSILNRDQAEVDEEETMLQLYMETLKK